ncbi:PRD domain-containing protein [Corynebacterium striatum]
MNATHAYTLRGPSTKECPKTTPGTRYPHRSVLDTALPVLNSVARQLDSPGSPVSNVINDQYPDAAQCARTVAGVIELRMNESLTADEITYLTLHIARLSQATK